MRKIVLFIFAGREENMSVQWPYLKRLLDHYPQMEVHLWDLTRRESDQRYINKLASAHPRVVLKNRLHPGHPIRCTYPGAQVRRRGYPACRCMLHKPPFEQPYRYYALLPNEYAGTIFVKVDDDVLFLETERFDDLISPLRDHPEVVYSANVVNNAVAAKYEAELAGVFEAHCEDPRDPANDKAWWALHIEPDFARASHDWFLDNAAEITSGIAEKPSYQPTREGEAISINCIAFTYLTMEWLAGEFRKNPRLGDEGAVDSLLPHIVTTFHAAHLTFGPQEKAMPTAELDFYRERYTLLRKDYLGE